MSPTFERMCYRTALAVMVLGFWLTELPRARGQTAPSADAGADETLPVPPVPPRIAESEQYDRCLDMLPTDPTGAEAMAASWETTGGGAPAVHCHALADIELGNAEAGAVMLDRLGGQNGASGASRAEILTQAAQAWTMAGQSRRAYDAATQGLNLSPDDVELHIARAIAAIALNLFAEAGEDLSAALEIDPKRGDALTLRAGAYRNLGKLDLARADIDRATALDDQNPDTLLERGIIRQRLGDLAGARTDWEKAADLGEDTATADLAQQNLALLAAGPRQ